MGKTRIIGSALAFIFILTAVFGAVSCNKPTVDPVDTGDTADTADTADTKDTADTEEPVKWEEQDLSILEVDRADAGNGMRPDLRFCLEREGKPYSIGRNASRMNIYHYYNDPEWKLDYPNHLISNSSLSDIPVPLYRTGEDKVIAWPIREDPDALELHKVSFTGYSISMFLTTAKGGTHPYWKILGSGGTDDSYELDRNYFKVTVNDSEGNEVTELHDLEKDSVYTVFWYEDVRYYETRLKASCTHYDVDESADTVVIDGVMTDEGYAVYDLSQVPAGLYMTNDYGLIEIK